MTARLSKEALERAQASSRAAEVLLKEAATIARACVIAHADEVVLAAVRPDLTFGGAHAVPLTELREQVLNQARRGWWCLVFSPGTSQDEIEHRCTTMDRLARARSRVIERWRSRHPDSLPDGGEAAGGHGWR